MAAEPERRYAYRADETNAPGLNALLEEWLLSAAGPEASSGTRIRWTFAADGPAAFRLALKAARPGLDHAFRSAVRALDARLTGGATRAAEAGRPLCQFVGSCQTPVVSSVSMVCAYGAMSRPCSASQAFE